jgi:hypothetical protein
MRLKEEKMTAFCIFTAAFTQYLSHSKVIFCQGKHDKKARRIAAAVAFLTRSQVILVTK